jgi:hypothetical protein
LQNGKDGGKAGSGLSKFGFTETRDKAILLYGSRVLKLVIFKIYSIKKYTEHFNLSKMHNFKLKV